MRILFIEDDDSIREIYAVYIRNYLANVEVVTCSSGNQAIAVLHNQKFDLIISDYSMPDGSGGDVFQYIEQSEIITPFLLFTTKRIEDLSEFINFKKQNSHNQLLKKPLGPSQFVKLIAATLENVCQSPLSISPKNYIKVRASYLFRYNKSLIDIYLKISSGKYIKIINACDKYEKDVIEKFYNKGERFFYIRETELKNSLNEEINTSFLLYEPSHSMSSANNFLNSILVIKDIINGIGIGANVVSEVDKAIKEIDNMIKIHPHISKIFSHLKNGQNYFLDHSFALAYISSAICNEMEWSNDNIAYKLTMASIFHDILLESAPMAIDEWRKGFHYLKQNYSEHEYIEFLNHPIACAKLITELKDVPQDIATIISEHHEKPDGSGFPRKLTASHISPLSAIFIVSHDFVQRLYDNQFEEKAQYKIIESMLPHYTDSKFVRAILALKSILERHEQNAA